MKCGYEDMLRNYMDESAVSSLSLLDIAQGTTYPLDPGRHLVGRDAPGSQATVRLKTDNMMVSRNHFYIDVRHVEGKLKAYISLHENAKNAMLVEDDALSVGDVVTLNDGDVLDICGCRLKYQIK